MIQDEIDAPSLIRPLPYRIYLPPCYAKYANTRYPSLYLLHGLGANDSQWDEIGIDEVADELITNKQSPPFLIIMPHDVKGIEIETALTEVLIPYIDRAYLTKPDPLFRAIGGLSRGGGLALRIGLEHYDTFRTIGMHSPANLYSAPYIVSWTRDIPPYALPNIWVDIGDHDPLLKSTQELITLLNDLSIPTQAQINFGRHDVRYWSSQVDLYLRWYSEQWSTYAISESVHPEAPIEHQIPRDP